MYGLRSTILDTEPDKAEWLIDLLGKLGTEDDAYHAVALVMIDHDTEVVEADGDEVDSIEKAEPETLFEIVDVATAAVDDALAALPDIAIRHDTVPPQLQPSLFLATRVSRVLDISPVTRHREARRRRNTPRRA